MHSYWKKLLSQRANASERLKIERKEIKEMSLYCISRDELG